MPCDAIATARAKMPVTLPAEVISKLLQSEFPNLALNSYETFNKTVIYGIYGNRGETFRITYGPKTGAYEVTGNSDAMVELITTMLQRASAFVATRLFAKKGQILKAQRVKNATILKVRV